VQNLAGPGEVLREARDQDNCVLLADGLIAFQAGEDSVPEDASHGAGVTCICGAITASFAGALGLLEGLRDPILVPTKAEDPLKRHFDYMLEELAMPSFGTKTLTESLMKICLVTILRRQLEQPDASQPILAPLRDRRLVAAVAAIVDMPARAHTVASLAEVAGMGRTTFAERFVETYGRTPIDFLQAVRLRHAAHLLRTTAVPVKVIASAVGYRSRSQFSHAFRVFYNLDPSTFRQMSSAAREEDLQVSVPGRTGPEDPG
jgi:AraC-like DNA-binding protein